MRFGLRGLLIVVVCCSSLAALGAHCLQPQVEAARQGRTQAEKDWAEGIVGRCGAHGPDGDHDVHVVPPDEHGTYCRVAYCRRLAKLAESEGLWAPEEHRHHVPLDILMAALSDPARQTTQVEHEDGRRVVVSGGLVEASWPGTRSVHVGADRITVSWPSDARTTWVGCWRGGELWKVLVLRPGLILQSARIGRGYACGGGGMNELPVPVRQGR